MPDKLVGKMSNAYVRIKQSSVLTQPVSTRNGPPDQLFWFQAISERVSTQLIQPHWHSIYLRSTPEETEFFHFLLHFINDQNRVHNYGDSSPDFSSFEKYSLGCFLDYLDFTK